MQRKGDHVRRERDFYPTPESAIKILLNNYELKPGWILEPCAGDGAICKALREYSGWDGSITSVEIRPEEQGKLEEYCDEIYIKDFLEFKRGDFGYPPRTIITNPPFFVAKEIIEKCFEIADENTEIIMFLKLAFMETKDRREFWKKHPNVSLISLMERPSFTGKGTDFAAYGWFIWNNESQFIKPCIAV